MTTTPATIFVRLRKVGFHRWPNAPGGYGYLATRHRHVFHIEVRTTVTHEDREIEFHALQTHVEGLWLLYIAPAEEADNQSCETLARRIAGQLSSDYSRAFTVIVSEDGENGAEVTVESNDR